MLRLVFSLIIIVTLMVCRVAWIIGYCSLFSSRTNESATIFYSSLFLDPQLLIPESRNPLVLTFKARIGLLELRLSL